MQLVTKQQASYLTLMHQPAFANYWTCLFNMIETGYCYTYIFLLTINFQFSIMNIKIMYHRGKVIYSIEIFSEHTVATSYCAIEINFIQLLKWYYMKIACFCFDKMVIIRKNICNINFVYFKLHVYNGERKRLRR